MTERSKQLAPPPLREEQELGALLRQANEQYAAGLDEAAAYRRLQEQLLPPSTAGSRAAGSRTSPARHAAGAFLGALALAGGLVWVKASSEGTIVLGPEERTRGPVAARWAEKSASEASTVADTEQDMAALAVSPSLAESGLAAPAEVLTPRSPEEEPRREPQRKVVRPPAVSPREPSPREQATEEPEAAVETEAPAAVPEPTAAPELDCMQMARDGAPRQAESCFVTLASGAGLRAEMALHEMARLRRDVLGDASGALAALSEYRERFPRGSLRHEVALSRVELLVRLGRTRDALRESEELLTSPDGRVRAAELHVLRGNMYRTALSDPRSAAAEFARAERLGGALGAEATYLRGTCLEALGDEHAALEAYERYLKTPRRPRVAEVQRRIAALSGAAQRTEQQP